MKNIHQQLISDQSNLRVQKDIGLISGPKIGRWKWQYWTNMFAYMIWLIDCWDSAVQQLKPYSGQITYLEFFRLGDQDIMSDTLRWIATVKQYTINATENKILPHTEGGYPYFLCGWRSNNLHSYWIHQRNKHLYQTEKEAGKYLYLG